MNIAATGGFAGGGAGGILTGGGDQLRGLAGSRFSALILSITGVILAFTAEECPLEDALNLVAPVGNPFALDPNASAPGNGGGCPVACPDFG